jgi:hypothetical protein
MRYLDTAFAQLAFSIKLMQAAENGALDLAKIDIPLSIRERSGMLVLPDRVFETENDAILACQNMVSVSFGAAAITLNRSREERGLLLPNPIESESEQWIALVYQIRNSFAHDISEPKWEIRGERYKRRYDIAGVIAGLSDMNGRHFEYDHIGGAESLFALKAYAIDRMFF